MFESTWEPVEHLANAPDIVRHFIAHVLVLSEFGFPVILPFWDPWSFCHWAHPCLGP